MTNVDPLAAIRARIHALGDDVRAMEVALHAKEQALLDLHLQAAAWLLPHLDAVDVQTSAVYPYRGYQFTGEHAGLPDASRMLAEFGNGELDRARFGTVRHGGGRSTLDLAALRAVSAPPAAPAVPVGETTTCSGCGVAPGAVHDDGCDVARCRMTGKQQIMCGFSMLSDDENMGCGPDCGPGVWTGMWPGVAEARERGWYVLDTRAGFVRCDAATPGATEDLNRVVGELRRWDRATQRRTER